jgi:hypothetical protein
MIDLAVLHPVFIEFAYAMQVGARPQPVRRAGSMPAVSGPVHGASAAAPRV